MLPQATHCHINKEGDSMQRVLTLFTTAVALLLLGKVALAQQMVGATVEKGFPCRVAALASGPGITPLPVPGNTLGLGAVTLFVIGSTTLVTTPDGSMNVSCHGTIPLGEAGVTVIDNVSGQVITDATLGTFEEDCALLDLAFPNVCRGSGAAIINTQTTGILCSITPSGSPDWIQIITPSGDVNLTCHSRG
jgi:hypothetical protein